MGGADKGGIIVREELDLTSPALGERLATGAQVKERRGPLGCAEEAKKSEVLGAGVFLAITFGICIFA